LSNRFLKFGSFRNLCCIFHIMIRKYKCACQTHHVFYFPQMQSSSNGNFPNPIGGKRLSGTHRCIFWCCKLHRYTHNERHKGSFEPITSGYLRFDFCMKKSWYFSIQQFKLTLLNLCPIPSDVHVGLCRKTHFRVWQKRIKSFLMCSSGREITTHTHECVSDERRNEIVSISISISLSSCWESFHSLYYYYEVLGCLFMVASSFSPS
jgi:hypothetical protein